MQPQILPIQQNSRSMKGGQSNFWAYLWITFMVASIFYVFRSGLPQPGDWMLVGIGFLLIINGKIAKQNSYPPVMKAMLTFVVYCCGLNLVWYLLFPHNSFLFNAAFFVFNYVACVIFWSLHQRLGDKLLYITGIGLVVSSVIESFVIQFVPALWGGARMSGTFNNPNQLAYFAILTMTMAAILIRSKALPKWLSTYGMTLCFIAAGHATYVSLSRAGIVVYLMTVLLVVVNNLRLLIVIALMGAAIFVLTDPSSLMNDGTTKITRRFRGSSDKKWEEFMVRNGSDRIKNYPQYLILGAGGGAHHRFQLCPLGRQKQGFELHSIHMNIFFHYGAVGFGLAFMIVFALYKKKPASLVFLLPVMAFGFLHNGIRQTEFWLLFLLINITIDRIEWRSQQRKTQIIQPANFPPSIRH